MNTGATDKQIAYAMSLMDQHGYSTRFMNADHKALCATMNQRQGLVTDWLKSLTKRSQRGGTTTTHRPIG